MNRRTLLATALLAPALARAEGRTLRVVNAYSAGGTADVVCRILCAALGPRLGLSVVVENRPGAAGTIAAQVVARAAADSTTLLYDATAHSVNPALFGPRLPYDTRRDLLPVFLAMVTPNTLMATNAFPVQTVPELIALAKSRPAEIACATTGIGTAQHVSLELLNHMAGIGIAHVAYREMASARNDLTAGRIPLQFSNVPNTLPLLQSGQVRCIALTGPAPLDILPGVPVFADTLSGYETWEWNGFFAPANTPSGLIRDYNAALNAVIAEPPVLERLTGLGALTRANTAEEFNTFREQQITFFAGMVKTANIRID
ncbi:tripartite tricarboxylate transporter substrate binding protein [Belnapia sp. T18]|uniref:Tripartite tricarboxylate transporter substrate binding protein n=1 Tax=Belnapia arida TaxID=2804533 RepID=A0ABS1U6J1_9PROT|nr:tripartite tricarboxylate transporter substrate-binding protein [Belnapia arida]MBL6080279.1 tripartite tricarboxylate transporter substrate binding protein [Belnapia arida]